MEWLGFIGDEYLPLVVKSYLLDSDGYSITRWSGFNTVDG